MNSIAAIDQPPGLPVNLYLRCRSVRWQLMSAVSPVLLLCYLEQEVKYMFKKYPYQSITMIFDESQYYLI